MSIMRPTLRQVIFATLVAATGLSVQPAAAQESPDTTVKRVAEDTLAAVRSDPQIQAGNQARIREVVETKVAPYFDFTRITALAMGKNWRTATSEQQKRLTDEFRSLLVRTYSGALAQYRDEKIEYKPLRMNAGDTDVLVRTAIVRSSGPPVPIDYSMQKTAEGWKCYDVVVGGVSLVTNYRDEFNAQVEKGGVDGLIKAIADRNKGVAAK
jgi:phospholipid transport system substrate-binding protein